MVVVDWLQYWIIPSAAYSKNIGLSNVLSETFHVKKIKKYSISKIEPSLLLYSCLKRFT